MGRKLEPEKSLEPEIYRKNLRAWFMFPCDIRYSFDMLEKVALDLGVKLSDGDILIVHNSKRNRCKIFKKTLSGAIMLYAMLYKDNTFVPLRDRGNGLIDGRGKSLSQYLTF